MIWEFFYDNYLEMPVTGTVNRGLKQKWLSYRRNGGSVNNGMVAQLHRTGCSTGSGFFNKAAK
jgi:hypothetical protein